MKYCVEENTHTQREAIANVMGDIMEKVSRSQRLLDALGTQYLEATADECSAEQEYIADMIAAISGTDWKVTYKAVTSSRIDTSALKKALPDLAQQFTKTTTARRFCIA